MDSLNESSQTMMKREVSIKKNHLISLFNNFEVTISDKKKKYVDKLQSLISAWEQISTFVSESSAESPQPAFDALFSHTLRYVLRADWRNVSKATKTHLSLILQRILSDLISAKRFFSILPLCRVLESVINDPWNHPVLKKIFEDDDIDIDDLIDYFHVENGKVIVVRLEILLESKCEDLAIRLSKACLMTFNLTDPLELELNQSEVDYITDIYLCCLYRAKNTKDIISELKTFDLYDGLYLLQRYNKQGGAGAGYNENCKEARVWKCSRKVIELISSTLLANAVLQDNFSSSDIDILQDLIREWASVHTTSLSDVFSPVPTEMIWKCVLIARCSMCIYPFCSYLLQCGGKQHNLNHLLRCLIRAINQNMNEIEQHRVCRNNEKLKFAHDLLAKGYLLTAELFREYRHIFKECLLTAFSLNPTRDSLQQLEDFVNNDVEDSVTQKTPVTAPENEIKIKTESASDNPVDQNFTIDDVSAVDTPFAISSPVRNENASDDRKPTKNELNAILETMGLDNDANSDLKSVKADLDTSSSTISETIKGPAPAYITEVDSMKIEDSIKTDLNSILRYQRHHTLTWDFEWPVLKVNCEKYHEMFEKRGFDEVELKYLELDYNQFKNHPVDYDDYTGIEKGYEHFVTSEVEESEEEYGYTRKVGYSTDDSDYDEGYGRKKRKKSRTRTDDEDWRHKTSKKKRPKPKVKVDGIDLLDEHSADSLPNGDAADDEKLLASGKAFATKKKVRGRTRFGKNLSDSEDNADSQSENQPPEEEGKGDATTNGVAGDGNVKSSANNLQLLRQFRISLSRPLISEENTTNIARQLSAEENINKMTSTTASTPSVHDLGKPPNKVLTDGMLVQIKICIPKCDSYPYMNNVKLLEALYENRDKKPVVKEEPLPSPEIVATVVEANPSDDVKKVVDDRKTVDVEKSANLEETVNIEKTVDVENTANVTDDSKCYVPPKPTPLVTAKKERLTYPKVSKHAKRFAVNRVYRKKLFAVRAMHTKACVEGIDDLIGEIFPEFSSNGSWQTNGNFDENFFEPMPPLPPVPFQQPAQTLSEFLDTTLDSTLGPTSSTEATFVSSSIELPSHSLPITPLAGGSSPPICNELTPLQPASSPPLVEAITSYLNSTMDSIDSMYSYPSSICHSQQLAMQQSMHEDGLAGFVSPPPTELLDISASSSQQSMLGHTSLVEPTYTGYATYQQATPVPDDIYSMNVSSTYDIVATANSGCVTVSSPSSSMLVNGVLTPVVHSSSNDVSAIPRPASSIGMTKPNSRLRAALQKPNGNVTVNLYDIGRMPSKKSNAKKGANNSVAVSQILDEYRDTMDKHPELGRVKARRKRGQDQSSGEGGTGGNPLKRPRRSKKGSVAAATPSRADYSLPSPNAVQVPSAMVNSPLCGVRVPSSQLQPLASMPDLSNGGQMQPDLGNNSVYTSPSSDAASKLPSCATAGVSSQNYGDAVGGCNSEVTGDIVTTYETNSGDQLMNMNGYVEGVVCVPPSTTNTFWPEDTNLINLDAANMPVNVDNNCDDLKLPFLLATVSTDNTTNSTNPDVCISIPEDQYSEALLENCFPFIGGNSLLQSNDDVYSKNQNDSAAGSTQNLQYLDDNNVIKPQNSESFDSGVLLNMDQNLYYGSNFSAEMNNYET